MTLFIKLITVSVFALATFTKLESLEFSVKSMNTNLCYFLFLVLSIAPSEKCVIQTEFVAYTDLTFRLVLFTKYACEWFFTISVGFGVVLTDAVACEVWCEYGGLSGLLMFTTFLVDIV